MKMSSSKSSEENAIKTINDSKILSDHSSNTHSDIAINLEGSVPFLAKPQLLDTIMCRQVIRPRCKLGMMTLFFVR